MRAHGTAIAWLLFLGLVVRLAPTIEAAVTLDPLLSGLTEPTYVTHAGDGSGRLFLVEQSGVIRVLQPGSATPTIFLDIRALVRSPQDVGGGIEEGLLSMAFHPDYASNGLLYIYYTDTSGDNNVYRYSVSTSDPDLADDTTALLILNIPHPTNNNHNGGQLNFGPDGFLYISTGDGGGGGDPDRNGQDPTVLLGKLLRIDVDSATPYAIPSDNPFVGMGGGVREEIWALGLRNPWRFSFDRLTDDLIVADVGQNSREEIDVQPAGTGGLNYCWSALEGTLPLNGDQVCMTGAPTPPILEYGREDPNRCAITGGYRYRGTAGTFPAGAYLFGDFCSGEIFTLQNGLVTRLFDTDFLITSFGEDEAGELYLADRNGSIQRLASSATPEIQVGLNRLLPYRSGETLAVGLAARNPGAPLMGDLYLGVILPGDSVVFITSLSPLNGIVLPVTASPATFPPLLPGVMASAGLEIPMQPVFAYTFIGGEPAGTYRIFAALTTPGALADGSIDGGDVRLLSVQELTFTP
jgi:hypothetical protein